MDSVHIVDQAIRKLFSSSPDIDSIAKARNISVAEVYNVLSAEMVRIDSANMRFTDSVIKIYGYPGKSLVGENASYAAWSVIQHSNRIDEFMPLLKDAVDKGEQENAARMRIDYKVYKLSDLSEPVKKP